MDTTTITVSREGRRSYLLGNTYPVKGQIKAAGGHWDADRKAWWIGNADKAAEIAAAAGGELKAAEERTYRAPEGEAFERVAGNTYPVKDRLRELGGRWNAAAKVWEVPASKAAKARELVGSAPKRSWSGRSGSRGGYRGRSRGRWTGCSCGSIEDEPRDSDCASCQHDY